MNIDPALLARTYRDPVALAFLITDLLPVISVLLFGWGAIPLVFLYWLENVVIGVVTIARMLAVGALNKDESLPGAAGMSVFFTVHYGMFCFVHGVFLVMFAAMSVGDMDGGHVGSPASVLGFAIGVTETMGLFIALIFGVNALAFINDYIVGREAGDSTVQAEMMSPYGRIVVLHIGIFAGAGALIALGEPMVGVLALILLRVIWGVFLSVRRRLRLDVEAA
ncbi:MAG: DUF6498-containing protein [Pseudomonadota bacterium]